MTTDFPPHCLLSIDAIDFLDPSAKPLPFGGPTIFYTHTQAHVLSLFTFVMFST